MPPRASPPPSLRSAGGYKFRRIYNQSAVLFCFCVLSRTIRKHVVFAFNLFFARSAPREMDASGGCMPDGGDAASDGPAKKKGKVARKSKPTPQDGPLHHAGFLWRGVRRCVAVGDGVD